MVLECPEPVALLHCAVSFRPETVQFYELKINSTSIVNILFHLLN